MKNREISQKRRQVLMAGMAAPAMLAASAGAAAGPAGIAAGERLVLSGRVLDEIGRPLAGATIEMPHPGIAKTITTDGDGRFFVEATAGTTLRHLDCRVTGREGDAWSDRLDVAKAHFLRDEDGILRGTLSLSLA